jgi:carbonic anhydrase/acetyltransferase-like protein (isoleucine patch superfamily)
MNKYELTTETLQFAGHILHRIKALKDFRSVKAGELGGWIESEENLSQADNAWVYNNAKVFDKARVYGNAAVSDDATVCSDAKVYGKATVYGEAIICGAAEVYGKVEIFDRVRVYGTAMVYGDAWVFDDACICGEAVVFGGAVVSGSVKIMGNAKVSSNKDYIVFKNFWSSGRYFTWTRSNNKWSVGCFYGTGEELIEKAYIDSNTSGREYERVVRYVESILADEKERSN